MADNWTDWYSGSMAPPVRLPGGGYLPAPTVQAPMSVEDIYRGIIPSVPSAGMSSVSRPAVPINPATGMPYATTVNAKAQYAGGIGAGATGQIRYSPPVYQPNGTTVANKDQSRLPAIPAGLPLAVPMASARGQLGASGFGGGSFSLPRVPTAPDDGIIDLSTLDLSDRGAQGMADSQGAPVRAKSGKVYYPGGKAPAGKASGSLSANDTRGPLSRGLGLKSSGLGGLLGSIFGGTFSGGGSAIPQSGGSIGLFGNGSVIGNSPSQGQAMVVSPGTSTGSTLSSMGFSDGAVVPGATIRSLSERGYI